jgi:hypothetical protein
MAKAKLPSFVVLAENFAWMENGCLMSFEGDKVIRDPGIIRLLIEKKAPLLEGGL